MNNPDSNHLDVLSLPDEVLFIVVKKLNVIDALHSLVDVNRRFQRLVLDPHYIHDLDMTDSMIISSQCNQISSIDDQVLSSICEKILPRIHHQVHQLVIEQYSMERILRSGNYPQLYSLSLINFDEETLYQNLTNNSILRDFLSKQITHLNIDIKNLNLNTWQIVAEIFKLILTFCKKLTDLNFCDVFLEKRCPVPVFYLLSKNTMSSTLTKLKINVSSFIDVLVLLDGRFEYLSTLIIRVDQFFDPVPNIGWGEKLPKLKCFSFTTFALVHQYDELIVPLLCRMINLEELSLYLSVYRTNSRYLDGTQFHDQFLIDMPQLNKFTFNIKTEVVNSNVTFELQSEKDIQDSFTGRYYQQVASHTSIYIPKTAGICHIYSLPFAFEYFLDLDHSFRGGAFHRVRYLKMEDSWSFEYSLFQIISRDMPFLQYLYINNVHQQYQKERSCGLLTLPYLTYLNLKDAHSDYAEVFLLKKNTYLPGLLNLHIDGISLKEITKNFSKDPMDFNFQTLRSLQADRLYDRPENFHEYFSVL